MTPQDRRLYSEELLARSETEFQPGGDNRIAAELLWGATAQLLWIVIAAEPTLTFSGHQTYREAAEFLDHRTSRAVSLYDFDCANKLHQHFYQGHLQDKDLLNCRRIAKRFITRLRDHLDQPTRA